MKSGFVKSSNHFLPLVKRAALIFTLLLLAAALFIPAPLKEAADRGLTPNPSKSAWFLLWIQELVSWSNQLIWLVIAISTLLIFLPWLPGQTKTAHASWFPRNSIIVQGVALLATLFILALTVIAMFMRGANWSFVF
ncbi:MAG: cytochrome B6 [Geobacteraceae bacterium]|nr:cytochrome B6 [Geobacteraceae bacterium]